MSHDEIDRGKERNNEIWATFMFRQFWVLHPSPGPFTNSCSDSA
ncbi:unnamed protein product, partial [Linum tenue]